MRAKTNKRGMLGPVLFVGTIGTLAAVVTWVHLRPKTVSPEQRVRSVPESLVDAIDDVEDELPKGAMPIG